MRKYLSTILMLIMCLIIYGCEKTKVTFNYNCEGVSNYECNVSNKKLDCTFTMPECNGREFIGWYDNPSNGNRVNLDKDFEENTTLYAHWIDKSVNPTPEPEPEPTENTTYKIEFNANGGSGGQTTPIEIKYEETLPQISEEKPIKEGYIFKGWYDNSDYTRGIEYYDTEGKSLRLYDKKNDLILYAGWEKDNSYVEPEPEPTEETKYEITFKLNGGSGTLQNDISIEYNGTLPSINTSVPTRTGYEFTGWYDNSDYTKGNKYYSTDGKSVRNFNRKSDMTLYAGWKIKTYTITYNLNGGSNGQTGGLGVEYNGELPTISKSIPTRSGYTFTGWYDNSDYTKGKEYYNSRCEAVRNYDKTNNITLYAGWSKVVIVQTYEVTFNINGGVGNVPRTVNAVLGNAMPSITSSAPSRSGYTFMGWYDNADYTKGTQYYTNKNVSARSYDKTNGTTLYAGWKENIFTISFNANGGSGGQSASVKVKPNETLPSISKTKPTRKGYTFMGWYDNKDYTKGTQYYKADCTPAMTYKVSKNISLYAGWEEKPYARVNYSNFKWTYYKKKSGPAASYYLNIVPYAIWAPENLNDLNGVSLPLIIWLHGAGEMSGYSSTDASRLLNSGLLKVMSSWNTYNLDPVPAIIVAPQSAGQWSDGTTNSDSIKALIKYATDYYNIDTNKIVFMGHSMGGYGVIDLSWSMKSTQQFYSIVIMSANRSSYKGNEGQEFFSKQKLRGYSENTELMFFFKWANQSNNYTYYKGVSHGNVPEKAMTEDTNGDKVSDLMTWLFGEDAKIR